MMQLPDEYVSPVLNLVPDCVPKNVGLHVPKRSFVKVSYTVEPIS